MTTPEHDQPDHEGLFPASKQITSKKLRLQYGYFEYKRKALLIKVGFCDVLVWSLNTNEVREIADMVKFNLNKTQSINDALRIVYMEEEGGFRDPLEEGSETNPNSISPHIRTLKIGISKLRGSGPIIRCSSTYNSH